MKICEKDVSRISRFNDNIPYEESLFLKFIRSSVFLSYKNQKSFERWMVAGNFGSHGILNQEKTIKTEETHGIAEYLEKEKRKSFKEYQSCLKSHTNPSSRPSKLSTVTFWTSQGLSQILARSK